ncbi:unnamed protein product [Rhizophagus irregularis]|uniref:Uncharacterized protein n=1 Tax=Rhizophagus irregularis TaxID=588596 RepID=A0A915ZPH8_9GLOM|nr:unnamed protein product [Rhizophagus irregularis]CAB5385873.1 unnamed protein product [Rhizophagus irregularis]
MVSYEKKMLEKGDIDQAAMVRNINIAFSSILFDQSLIYWVREGNQFRKEEGIGKVDKRSRNDILGRVNNENKKNRKKGDNNEKETIDSTRVPDVIIMPNFFVQEFIVSWEAGNLRFYRVIYYNNYLKSSDFSVMDIRVSKFVTFQHNSSVIRGKNI